MQLSALLLGAFVSGATAVVTTVGHNSTLDINQAVYIENAPVLGAGAGEGSLNQCTMLTDAQKANEAAPFVKVCGTGIKATFYLRGRCKEYYEHMKVVGQCSTKMDSVTCDEWSPEKDAKFGHYQSYVIEQC